MNGEQELISILWRWKEASERVECAPGEVCLTAGEIAAYVDDELEVAERRRVADHLSQCSYCTREVGSLLVAARDFDDRMRVREALGGLAGRVTACLRVFVEEAHGAFTRVDGLLPGLAGLARLDPVLPPPAFGLAGARGEAPEEEDVPENAVHEGTIHGPGLPGTDFLCGREHDGGTLTMILDEPWPVCVVGPDGTTHIVEPVRGDDRYYAMITGMSQGTHYVTVLRPET